MPPLILASASPRRAEILTNVGWRFEKITADVDESIIGNETPSKYVQRLAQLKAETVAARIENGLVLGADTTVVIDDEILGKPIDFDEAAQMLTKLSGRWHEVLTGVAIAEKSAKSLITKVNVQSSKVKFAEISQAEIRFLVEKGSPLDKAGAYAVQGCAALFIEQIRGDYWNVVGLPVNLIYAMIPR
ncbi:MAG: septum formation inhibitor Maf [Pyrinomonadaceae bacterium]|nr:septum formation inhibitor Maf [Pyrinomonadaceae bacterium]